MTPNELPSAPMIKVGLIDSGLSGELAHYVIEECRFHSELGATAIGDTVPDTLGHGTAIARIILSQEPNIALVNAQVFTNTASASPATVAAAIRWAALTNAQVINLSIGIKSPNNDIEKSIRFACERGVIIVASSPTRGQKTYPAAYPGVISVTGEIRCQPGTFSYLNTAQADFGSCSYWSKDDQTKRKIGGSSFATAYATGAIAKILASSVTNPTNANIREKLAALCSL